MVDKVLTIPSACGAASNRHLISREGQQAVAIVEGEMNLGQRRGGAATAAGVNQLFRTFTAECREALFAQHPTHRISEIRLPAAIWPHNSGNAGAKRKHRAAREGLKALHFETFKIH